jgi:hypothetical protein
MDRNKIIAIWLLRRRCTKRQRNRLLWVHPINLERDQLREFDRQFEGLRCDENKFFNYFRMSINSFDELHNRLKNTLQRQNTKMRNCIQPIQMLAYTIR